MSFFITIPTYRGEYKRESENKKKIWYKEHRKKRDR